MSSTLFQPTSPLDGADNAVRLRLGARVLLLALTLLAVLPMVALELGGHAAGQAEQIRHTEDHLDNLAVSQAAAHQRLAEGTGQLLVALAASPVVTGTDEAACSAYLKQVMDGLPGYANLGVIGVDGQLRCRASGERAGGVNLGDRDYFRQALAAPGTLAVSRYIVGRLTGRKSIILARAIMGEGGQVRGVAYASIDVAWLDSQLQIPAASPGVKLQISDVDARLLACTASGADQLGSLIAEELPREAVRSGRSGVLPDAGDTLVAVRPVWVGGVKAMAVVVSEPRAQVLGAEVAQLRLRLAGLLALTLGLAALVWVLGERMLARPLARLVRGMEETADGHYAAALQQPATRVAELARLQHSLGELVRALEMQGFERDQALAALQEREARYRELFEANPQVMYVYDIRSLRFLAVNAAAVAYYGYSRDEFLEMNLLDIRPVAERRLLLAELARRDSATLSVPTVWNHLRKNGDIRQVQVVFHLTSFDGRPAQLVMVTDVTERLAAEARAREATEQLEQRVAERTRALEISNRELEAFAWSVSHDLRNPLRAVAMFRQLLADHLEAGGDDEARLYLRRMDQGLVSMEELIDQLMALARVSRVALVMAPVDLGALAREVLADLRIQSPERVVNVVIEDGLLCTGDASLLRQLMDNLLGNAWKFTARSPAAEIRVGRLAVAAGESPVFFVADNGAGFDMKFAERLFEPFERLHADEDFPGTGIGLATVQRVLARHGGRIWADAAVGRGATFYFVVNPSEAG